MSNLGNYNTWIQYMDIPDWWPPTEWELAKGNSWIDKIDIQVSGLLWQDGDE